MSKESWPVAEESHTDDRFGRAIDEQRARSLHQLHALAANALGDLFPARRGRRSPDFGYELARTIARDLTALGMVVHDSARSVSTGGVWLAPCVEYPGVIVTWTQHEASATVLGPRLQRDLQETMNFDISEALRMLGYTVKGYGIGSAHLVTDWNR